MVSTLAGCASTLFSLTRDAAVYWASMNPELVPASGARKGASARSARTARTPAATRGGSDGVLSLAAGEPAGRR